MPHSEAEPAAELGCRDSAARDVKAHDVKARDVEGRDVEGRDVGFRVATFTDLDARTLHDLLRLRADVFVVEQACAYPDIDGRDVEPGTRHLWLARAGQPVAYLRILAEPDGSARIGRVVVAASARGAGYAGRLMAEALALVGDRPCVLAAQAHLADFYTRYGFVPTGPEFVEDGIAHLPMRRTATVTPRR